MLPSVDLHISKLNTPSTKEPTISLKDKISAEKHAIYNKYSTAFQPPPIRLPKQVPNDPKPRTKDVVSSWLELGSSQNEYADMLPRLPVKGRGTGSVALVANAKAYPSNRKGLVASERKLRQELNAAWQDKASDWVKEWFLERVSSSSQPFQSNLFQDSVDIHRARLNRPYCIPNPNYYFAQEYGYRKLFKPKVNKKSFRLLGQQQPIDPLTENRPIKTDPFLSRQETYIGGPLMGEILNEYRASIEHRDKTPNNSKFSRYN